MEHVVFYPGPDGADSFRRTPSLEEAVRFVEHLRNTEEVTAFSVHTLTEVPLTFRAYYRAEVPGSAEPSQDESSEVVPVAAAMPVDSRVVEDPEEAAVPVQQDGADEVAPAMANADVLPGSDADGAPNGRRGLGFFSH